MWQKNVKCDVRTVQLRMKPTNVKEIKKKKNHQMWQMYCQMWRCNYSMLG